MTRGQPLFVLAFCVQSSYSNKLSHELKISLDLNTYL